MKKVVNKWKLLLLMGMITLPRIVMAQTGFEDQLIDVPFDGGVSLLVAAGVAYGLKKAYDKKNK